MRSGQDPQRARYLGTPDLRDGVDLSENSLLRLRVDDIPTVTANCAGAVPQHTTPDEVIEAINTAIGVPVAAAVGGRLQLSSPFSGELAEVVLEPVSGDASPALLGLPPRLTEGAAATAAHVTGTTDLSAGAVVSSRYKLELAVDGGPFVDVDVRSPARLPLDDLVARINTAIGDDVATHDGAHLILRSRHPGGGSRVQVRPVSIERRRRFVTRAFVTGEAAETLLGVERAVARGDDESRAVVVGTADLSHGVDLSAASFVRIGIDDREPVDVDCAGGRARATVLDEIVAKLNAGLDGPIASHDGTRLTLQSPTEGGTSRIAFEVPQAQDARPVLVGDVPTFARGEDARGVTLVGVTDLSGGVDLPAHAALRIGIDATPLVDVPLTGDDPGHRSRSPRWPRRSTPRSARRSRATTAHTSRSRPRPAARPRSSRWPHRRTEPTRPRWCSASATAATTAATPEPAVITGTVDVSGALTLGVTRFLVLALDGRDPVTVDCGTATTAAGVVAAVNAALQAAVASVSGNRLVLTSASAGSGARITLAPHTGGDARTLLFGDVPATTTGLAAHPATLTGTVDLLGPADLSARSTLLLAVDSSAPREIDVAGAAPAQTTLDEVVAAIDAVLPGVAVPTADRRLQLISPSTGPASRIEVLPLRSLEVVEYPAADRTDPPRPLRHGDSITLDNDGAGDSFLTVRIDALQGNGGPALVNRDSASIVALLRPLNAGESATIWRGDDGRVHASVGTEAVPPTQIRAGRLGAWTSVAVAGSRTVPGGGLQLANPWAAGIDTVLPRVAGLKVDVQPAAVTATTVTGDDGDTVSLTATLRRTGDGWHLRGAGDADLIAARAGAGVTFAGQDGAVVGVTGTFREDEPPYLLVTELARRFDVTLTGEVPEPYPGVTIGDAGPDAFATRVMNEQSQLARVRTESPGNALRLDRGRTVFQVLECAAARFDAAAFDAADFAGGPCRWPGIFDVSTFALPGGGAQSVYAISPIPGPTSDWTFGYQRYTPAAFEVNLPADLPARFGGRFDEARFASDPQQPEFYAHAVTEPPGDDDNLIDLINARSVLVRAEPVAALPIGFTAVPLPTRAPRHLTGGGGPHAARLYLQEAGAEGFVLIEARENGEDGNLISVSSRPAGPARFDVTILADGARFESARAIVAGPPPALADRSTLEPTPLGVDEAKAAGTRVRVTRDRSGP